MPVLVLGGSGFIGPVDYLVRAGCQVALFNRGQSRVQAPAGVEHIRGANKKKR